MKKFKTSIFHQIRSEGYNEGFSQGSLLSYDDAKEQGRQEVYREYRNVRKLWWMIGFLCGIIITAVLGSSV